MNNIDWGFVGQCVTGAIIVVVLLGAIVLAYEGWVIDAKERDHDEAIEIDLELEREKVLERQRKLLATADAIANAPEPEKLHLMRAAEALGFIDEVSPRKSA